ncbi:hypothetical protein PIB30_098674, partial [Stylosanthes scabra]|nr:hypothetical protein [Stylosanthes scabra]
DFLHRSLTKKSHPMPTVIDQLHHRKRASSPPIFIAAVLIGPRCCHQRIIDTSTVLIRLLHEEVEVGKFVFRFGVSNELAVSLNLIQLLLLNLANLNKVILLLVDVKALVFLK